MINFLNKYTVERKYETNDLFVVPYIDWVAYLFSLIVWFILLFFTFHFESNSL